MTDDTRPDPAEVPGEPPVDGASPTRARTPRWMIATAAFVVVGAIVALGIIFFGGPQPKTHEIVIPYGTFGRISNGEEVEVMPTNIDLNVGDTLVIRNQDDAAFEVGPFKVSPGATYTQRFQQAQVLKGECSLNPDGAVTIRVT